MEPTNIKVGEYVGVYHDSKDGGFHFDTISAEVYDTAKQDSLVNNGLLHKVLGGCKRNTSPDLMAAFILSPNGFTITSGGYVQDGKTDAPLDDTILYISGIVILSECNGIIYDVLYDFMAINGMERGAEFIRVEVDLKASNDLNTNLASHLANDEESDYRLVDSDSKSAYFEAKLSDFEEE